jgi:outer membrane receptor for ferrienterochelin and colicins
LIDGNQAGGSAKTARGTQQYMMPIELVDHIELVIGPGSVIYGNSAMLGVINVVTRTAGSLEDVQVVAQASGGTPADYWSRNLGWGELWGRAAAYGSTRFQLGNDPFELVWHFGARSDRQQGRSVWRPVSGQDPFVAHVDAYTREDVFNRDHRARLFGRAKWGNWTLLSWIAGSFGGGTGPIAGTGASNYFESEYGLDGTWRKPIGTRGDLSLRTYAVVFDTRATTVPEVLDAPRCLTAVGTSPCNDTIQYISIKPYIEPIFTFDWEQDGSHVSTLGMQAFVDGSVITSGVEASDGSNSLIDAPIIAPLANVAAYGQHIWRGGFGTLNVGIRGDVGVLGAAISPRAAYSKSFWKDGTLKFIFSTGFRTPALVERYLEIENFLTSNPDIKPERVYSAEIDLAQRLGRQKLQVSLFSSYWSGLISIRGVNVGGVSLSQFANQRNVLSAGVNVGLQGEQGPFDWGLSLNYAPGRRRLPASIMQSTDQELADARVNRETLDRYGWQAMGAVFIPVDGMPDFYGTGHLSWSLGENLPRLSVAANLNSPRLRIGYANNGDLLDLRNADGASVPWTIDVRGAAEMRASDRVGLRLVVTGRSLATVANPPRVGDGTGPIPLGGIGVTRNPVAPLSAMAEVSVRL